MNESKPKPCRQRQMVCASLLGSHTHVTDGGARVHVYSRDGRFIARGRQNGRQFGASLGEDQQEAGIALRRILHDLDKGAFVPPSQRPKQLFKLPPGRMTVRAICERFLLEKRQLRGQQTASTYRDRLRALIEYSELPETLRGYPSAQCADRDFAIGLRMHVSQRTTSRNGRPAAVQRPISPHQVFNILDCARSLFNWATKPVVGLLPLNMANPFTAEIVGEKPRKDPLRAIPLSLPVRVQLVEHMDFWQVTHLALSLVLPLRPEDLAGLLIREVDFARRQLRFGTRFVGRDCNKGRQEFTVPFPAELTHLLECCRSGREDGPLLRGRRAFARAGDGRAETMTPADVDHLVASKLAACPRDELLAPQDAKQVIRRALREMGGVSTQLLAKEFRQCAARVPEASESKFYNLRGSCLTEMDRAGVPFLAQRYFSGHTTRDIMAQYVSIDVTTAMIPYFNFVRPLTSALWARFQALGGETPIRQTDAA